MRRWITLRSLLVLTAVTLVALTVVSACGGDDKKDTNNGRTPTVELATPPATGGTPGPEADIGGPDGAQPNNVPDGRQDDPAASTAEAASDATDEAEQVAEQATEDAEDAADDAREATDEARGEDN